MSGIFIYIKEFVKFKVNYEIEKEEIEKQYGGKNNEDDGQIIIGLVFVQLKTRGQQRLRHELGLKVRHDFVRVSGFILQVLHVHDLGIEFHG